jgi:hypothetical protein
MNAIIQCRFCGSKVIASDPSAKSINCPQCAASLPVEALWNVNAANTVAQDTAPEERLRGKGFPFVWMLLVFPFAILILCTVIPLTVMGEWAGVCVGLFVGGGLTALTLLRMGGRWTAGRAVWAAVVVLFWCGCSVSLELEKSRVRKEFGPIQTEFANFKAPLIFQKHPLKPKLFPLFIQSRGQSARIPNAPALPRKFDEYDLYKELPETLKAVKLEDVQSLALIEYGWQSDTHIGFCKVTVVDRKTRAVVASKSLQFKGAASTPPAPGLTMAKGPQPTKDDVIAYLRTLPVEAERSDSVETPESADEIP